MGKLQILREGAEDLFGSLRGAFECFDLREGVSLSADWRARFPGVGGVEELLLRGESGCEAALFVARGEPGVEGHRRDEQHGDEGGDFERTARVIEIMSGDYLGASDWRRLERRTTCCERICAMESIPETVGDAYFGLQRGTCLPAAGGGAPSRTLLEKEGLRHDSQVSQAGRKTAGALRLRSGQARSRTPHDGGLNSMIAPRSCAGHGMPCPYEEKGMVHPFKM